MLSDILSRLVETVAEQGEDMQVRALKKAPIQIREIQSSRARFLFFSPFNASQSEKAIT
jgi:hypothetical protein